MTGVAIHVRYSSDNHCGASIEDRPDIGVDSAGPSPRPLLVKVDHRLAGDEVA
jgi:hypothetical protein